MRRRPSVAAFLRADGGGLGHTHHSEDLVSNPFVPGLEKVSASQRLRWHPRVLLRRLCHVKACPACGQENPDIARFCMACTTPLAEPAPRQEERKVVTVLFADLVGFTSRSEAMDVEDVRGTLQPYHQLLRKELERYGGTVEKFIGDAVMALFGAPVAHEDDPERAVRAALSIQDAVARLREDDPRLDLHLRIGVNTGEALVALGANPQAGEGMASGDVVNTAARLQSVGPVDGVLVGDATRRATERAIEYESRPPVKLKGKDERVAVWRVVGARSRFGVDAEVGTSTPFEGRQSDLALLRQLYERTLAGAGSQLVTVVGEAGVGKSRLVRELANSVDGRPELAYWRQGRCLPYGDGITFWPLGEIVKAQAGILESDGVAEAERKLRASLVGTPDADWVRGHLAPLVGLAALAESSSEERFAAWRAYMEALAGKRPLILVVEDLHWADSAMLAFLDYLTEWGRDARMLVLCTTRPELYDAHPSWSGGKRNAVTVSLAPLSDDETARLVGTLLGRPLLDAETQSLLLDRAGGNPLYAEEFARALQETRATAVPQTLQSLIAARLDTLPAERKAVVYDAAVIGKVFWAGALRGMGVERDAADVDAALRDLVHRELVRAVRQSSVAGEQEYSFWHSVVRDVAYAQIPRAERAARHVAAAAWIEGLAGERLADRADVVAHHYLEAIGLLRGLGAPVGELAAKAAPVILIAAERLHVLDSPAASRMYQRALELLPLGSAERARTGAELAVTLGFLGAPMAEAQAVLEEADTDADASRSPEARAAVLHARSRLEYLRGRADVSLALVRQAADILEELPPSRLAAEVMAAIAWDEMSAGHGDEAIERADLAVDLAVATRTPRAALMALQARACARTDLRGEREGLDDFDRARDLADDAGVRLMDSSILGNRSDSVWLWDGPGPGYEMKMRAVELARRRGMATHAAWLEAESVWPLFDLGRWDEVLVIAQNATDRAERYGPTQGTVIALSHSVAVLALRGSPAAGSATDQLVDMLGDYADPQAVVPALVYAAEARLRQRRPSDAAELLGRLPRKHVLGLYPLAHACRLMLACGLRDDARATAALERPPVTRLVVGRLHGQAAFAEADDQLDEALARYAEAAERWERFPHLYERAEALLGSARCLDALGRTPEAAERRTAARRMLETLGVGPGASAPAPALPA
jgi:class 3 adenylate cyclase/tetratricopeptide (TPR) repeat protein